MKSGFLWVTARALAWWLWMRPRFHHLMLALLLLLTSLKTPSEFYVRIWLAPGEKHNGC